MKITNLHQFLESFFKYNECEVLQNGNGMLIVQLTEKMDKALMNRPFYWHYVTNVGLKGEPMKLTFITDNKLNVKHESGEWIHFGSPRLQQIMDYLKVENKFTKVFQKVETMENVPLFPWLLINLKISYEGIQKKEEIFSIGLNLVNGMMKVDMMNLLNNLSLQQSISDYCYLLSPLIKVQSGYSRIERVIDDYIQNQEHRWADEAKRVLEEEIEMIKHFYHEKNDEKQQKIEIENIKKRYTPTITYDVLSGGLVYLTD